jgi:PAS domain S-box-containing protein
MTRSTDLLEREILLAWMDNAQIGLFVVDDTNRVVMVNRELCVQFGLMASNVLDKPLGTLLRQVDDSEALQVWLANGLYGDRETRRHVGEGTRTYRLKSSIVRSAADEAFKVVAVTEMQEARMGASRRAVLAGLDEPATRPSPLEA